MAVTASELSIVYGAVTVGGSTARQITEWTRDEHDYMQGSFEFEFVTTAATDAAFATELNTIRNEFRKPRLDLSVTQNASTILSRKHSDNTGLDTFPMIVKDGDPADTGRSRHFRVRITYELPADNVSTSFRRGATITVFETPSRRRTVTVSGVYTANSTDGTTAANTQYFAQIAAAETTLLNTVDSSATWERVGQPQVEYFETRKLVRFTRVYREVNFAQSSGGATNDQTSIVDPHMEISVEEVAPGDSLEARLSFGKAGGAGANVLALGINPTSTGSTVTAAAGVEFQRPIMITIAYDCSVNFDTESGATKRDLWIATIRPWIIERAGVYNPGGTLVLLEEQPAYEDYENHLTARMQFISYSKDIIRQKISYQDVTVHGAVLKSVTSSDPFDYYDFQGPAVRQMIVTEEYEELTKQSSARAYTLGLYALPGAISSALGEKWRLISREPKVDIKMQGRPGAGVVNIATVVVVTVLQFRNKRKPSVANAGGVTGGTVTP